MEKRHLLERPVRKPGISFDELYKQISAGWRKKAGALQARRWQHIRGSKPSGVR